MKVDRENIIRTRTIMLSQMDAIIRCDIGDEDILESWLMCGVPDECDELDLIEIADDEDEWRGVVDCFKRCCKRAGVL